MSELTGGKVNYYLVRVEHPQRKEQAPYQAECEDIAEALGLTPNEFCEFKAIWRTAAARLGNGKPDHKALYDAQKRVHYATRDLIKLTREAAVDANPEPEEAEAEPTKDGQPLGDGWFAHLSAVRPEILEEDNMVEVTLHDGTQYLGNFAKKAKDWIWTNDGTRSIIVAWRLLELKVVNQELDTWKIHSGYSIPEGLDPYELVEVKLSNGHEVVMAKRADEWDWAFKTSVSNGGKVVPQIDEWRRYRHQAI